MKVSLLANQRVSSLADQLKGLEELGDVKELDLTNCILVEPDELPLHIGKCTSLQSLRCLACPLRPRDLLALMLERLPCLVEVELSLVGGTDVESEMMNLRQIALKFPGALALNLRHVYVEVGGYQNFKLLSALLRFFPKLDELHVHLVRGSFWNALLECSAILNESIDLEKFTFSSEVPATIQCLPYTSLELTSCAAVCANVSYQKSSNSWSCARLHDLALASIDPLILPSQLVVVAVHSAECAPSSHSVECFTEHLSRLASRGNVWADVRRLCLLLFPAEPSGGEYPMAGAAYRESLRDFFFNALRHIVELNISSFHFGPDLDLTELLQDGTLKHLSALSATPCGLRRTSSVRRLAQNCPDFTELDVRIYRRGSFVRCAVCNGGYLLDPVDMVEMMDTTPVFPGGLARLTIGEVHGCLSLWLIVVCPADTVRLSECPNLSHPDYPALGQVLAKNTSLRCLVLRHDALPIAEADFLSNISRIAELQYLCLLSAAPVMDDVAETSVLAFCDSLKPHIKCIHVHYQSCRACTEKRITWVQCAGGESGGILVRDGPCILCCSTATFIGLAKPLNRDFKPIM